MSHFTPAEIAYLQSLRVGRLATVNAAGDPHVVPVAYIYNTVTDTIDIAGFGMLKSKKYRDALRNPKAAFVADDVGPEPQRQPRGVETRGRAEIVATDAPAGRQGVDPVVIRIHPAYIVSWGIDTSPYAPNGRAITPTA